MLPNPQPYFADLPDPRRETKNKLHKLTDIIMIVLCAVLSGVEDWAGMEEFAEEKEAWLRGFLELPHGIPSHDTLSDVLGRIRPAAFTKAFTAWVQAALPSLAGEQVAIDGKTLRGSDDGHGPVHLVSAFAAKARWVLSQPAVAEKSNEITAIPDLLDLLELAGATVTIDAMGCQKAIAKKIVAHGADYVLALKDNQPTLHEDVALWLDTEAARGRLPVLETVEKGHGRLETRRYWLSDRIDWLGQKLAWAGLTAVGMVESTRDLGNERSTERRYFLCSFADLPRFAEVVRGHWSIENQAHWVLDVQLGEDAHLSRKNHAPTNLGLIRRMALNLLRREDAPKVSLKRRKLRAALNDEYRTRLLFGAAAT